MWNSLTCDIPLINIMKKLIIKKNVHVILQVYAIIFTSPPPPFMHYILLYLCKPVMLNNLFSTILVIYIFIKTLWIPVPDPPCRVHCVCPPPKTGSCHLGFLRLIWSNQIRLWLVLGSDQTCSSPAASSWPWLVQPSVMCSRCLRSLTLLLTFDLSPLHPHFILRLNMVMKNKTT